MILKGERPGSDCDFICVLLRESRSLIDEWGAFVVEGQILKPFRGLESL